MTPQPSPVLPSPAHCRSVVVGGGTMGADVAVVLARATSPVVVVEPNASRHAGIQQRAADSLAAIGLSDRIEHLQLVTSLDAIDWAGIHLVIECIPESLPAKQALFAELVQLAPPHTVLASNSSSFPISHIAQGLDTQARMIGLHFFMPAHLVPLVEVVLGAATDPAVADTLAAFMKRCGMVPVIVRKDVPGFLANRLQHALGREAFALIQEGIASPEDVDAAVRFGFGFRYLAAGPLMQRDHAGLDVHHAAASTMYPTLSNADVPPAILGDRVRDGKLGMKTGEGFFPWTPESMAAERARYDGILRGGLSLISKELPPIEP